MFWSCTVVAGEDMSAIPQFIAVNLTDGKPATNFFNAGGIIQNRPKINEHGTVFYAGESEYRAGAAVVKGARLTVTQSGWLITVTSGGSSIGRALVAVASGGIGRGLFNFQTPSYVNSL